MILQSLVMAQSLRPTKVCTLQCQEVRNLVHLSFVTNALWQGIIKGSSEFHELRITQDFKTKK